jgi:hypothetical protein
MTGSPRGKISIARERVGRCVRCRLTELDEYYGIVTIVKELEKIYSEKVLNLDKFYPKI